MNKSFERMELKLNYLITICQAIAVNQQQIMQRNKKIISFDWTVDQLVKRLQELKQEVNK